MSLHVIFRIILRHLSWCVANHLSLCILFLCADPHPVCVWDNGAEVSGGGHPSSVLLAVRCLP